MVWRKDDRKSRDFSDFDLDFGFEDLEKIMDEMLGSLFEEPFEESKPKKPLVMGFSMHLGPEGKPIVERFGNIEQGPEGMRLSDKREPLYDVIYKQGEIIVTVELPGVKKDEVDLKTQKNSLVVSVDVQDRNYFKKINLKEEIKPKEAKASFNNGVLEVRLKRVGMPKPKASDKNRIKIE